MADVDTILEEIGQFGASPFSHHTRPCVLHDAVLPCWGSFGCTNPTHCYVRRVFKRHCVRDQGVSRLSRCSSRGTNRCLSRALSATRVFVDPALLDSRGNDDDEHGVSVSDNAQLAVCPRAPGVQCDRCAEGRRAIVRPATRVVGVGGPQ